MSSTALPEPAGAQLSSTELRQYDRQVRLWGAGAQRAISSSRVLVAGLGALGAEVAKNLMLAGVGDVTLCDGAAVSPADEGASFLVAAGSAGRNRAEASLALAKDLNPLVSASARACAPSALDDAALKLFHVVVLCGGGAHAAVALCGRCRALGVPVVASDASGWWGSFFVDAGPAHAFERVKAGTAGGTGGGEASAGAAAESAAFRPLAAILAESAAGGAAVPVFAAHDPKYALPFLYAWVALHSAAARGTLPLDAPAPAAAAAVEEEALRLCCEAHVAPGGRVDAALIRALADARGAELAPVAAVVGGLVGNEVVKLLTHKDAPVNNFFAFDAMGGEGGRVFSL